MNCFNRRFLLELTKTASNGTLSVDPVIDKAAPPVPAIDQEKFNDVFGITLTAEVGKIYLVSDTANLMATTQRRVSALSTIRRTCWASLNDRASDLTRCSNSIGQATLGAANNGITSITQLVQSAKSIAQQVRALNRQLRCGRRQRYDCQCSVLNGTGSSRLVAGRGLVARDVALPSSTATGTVVNVRQHRQHGRHRQRWQRGC